MGFIAQQVEHCSVKARAMGSNPVEGLKILNCDYNCDGRICISFVLPYFTPFYSKSVLGKLVNRSDFLAVSRPYTIFVYILKNPGNASSSEDSKVAGSIVLAKETSSVRDLAVEPGRRRLENQNVPVIPQLP